MIVYVRKPKFTRMTTNRFIGQFATRDLMQLLKRIVINRAARESGQIFHCSLKEAEASCHCSRQILSYKGTSLQKLGDMFCSKLMGKFGLNV